MTKPNSGPTLSRAQRTHVDGLQDQVNRVLQGDARFFARFPHRSHRVRLAAAVEITLNAAVHGAAAIPDEPDCRWFVVVKQVQTGSFARAFIQTDPNASTDLCEDDAKRIYDVLTRSTAASSVEQPCLGGLPK